MQPNDVEVQQNSVENLLRELNDCNDRLNRLWERFYEEKERRIKANIKMSLLLDELEKIFYDNEEARAQIRYFLESLE